MKKTLYAISAIAVLLGFTACTSENEIVEPQNEKVTITLNASTEETTRTALDGNDADGYNVFWSDGDVIAVGTCNFTLSSGKETTQGEFTYIGTAPANDTYDAWYGVSSANFLSAQQIYNAGKITNSPMHTKVTIADGAVAEHVTFKNLCGLLKLSVKGTSTVKTITISANEAMAGAFTVNTTTGGAEMAETASRKSITLDCGAAGVALNESTATDFYIAMPANTYTGVTIKLTDTDSKVCTKTFKGSGLVVERSKITKASFTASTFAAPEALTTINGHACVELAGYYWATENVGEATGVTPKYSGATNNDYGCYFYMQPDAIKAAESWGGTWTLPTAEQWNALLSGCTWTWKTGYEFGGKTMNGYLVSDKTDTSKFIFLPAAGYYWSNQYNVQFQKERLLYWSSTVNNSKQEQSRGTYLYYDGSNTPYIYPDQNELTGFSVRPVAAALPAKPDGALSGKFSVSDTKQVYFAKGNLYYDGSAFQLESNQYSIETSWNASHVSNFFWSKTAADACADSYSAEIVAAGDVFFTNATGFTVNGQTGVWRTLSHAEWNYLFTNYAYKYVSVCGKSGLVIAPTGVTVDGISASYDATTWPTAESNGYVFLPNTGFRGGSGISETDKSCLYWSSTLSADNKPYRQFFQWNGSSLNIESEDASLCDWGIGIRLVTDVK